MKITNLKYGKRGKIIVYADGNYLSSLPAEILLNSGLNVGSYVDENIINGLLEKVNKSKAKEKAFRLLSYRAHSKSELCSKIERTFGKESAEMATSKMEDLGLIDDEKFAIDYANELFRRKFYAISRIKYELGQKGIQKEIIDKVFDENDFDETENLSKLIEKKYPNGFNSEKEYRRAVAYLQRLGYSYSQIKSKIDYTN